MFVLAQVLNPVPESVSPQCSDKRNTLGMMGTGAIEMLAREITVDLQAIHEQAHSEPMAAGAPVTKDLVTQDVPFGQLIAHTDGSVDTSGVEGVDADLIIRSYQGTYKVSTSRPTTRISSC